MNLLTICGRLGRDPEAKETKTGAKYTKFSLCANVGKGSQIWWDVMCWGDKLSPIIKHLRKGSQVIAVGHMAEPRLYAAKDGTTKCEMSMRCESISFCGSPEKKQDSPSWDEPSEVPSSELPF